MLLNRFSRISRNRRHLETEYEKLLENPVHILLAMWLERAVSSNAHAIVFGFRGDEQSARKHAAAAPTPLQMSEVDDELSKTFGPCHPRAKEAENLSTCIRGPFHLGVMPVCALYPDRVEQLVPIPLHCYPTILSEIENRLVSLNGTPETPQPRKYIEVRPKNGQRHLIEVNLEWSLHDQFIIHVRSHHVVPADAHISTDFY
jgi:hypothetical protein